MINLRLYVACFLLLLFIPLLSFCKDISKTDSLETLLKNAKDNAAKIPVLLQLAEEYAASNKNKSIDLSNEAWNLSKKINDKKNEACALNQISKSYLNSDPDKSFDFSKQAFGIAKKSNNRKEQAEALKNMGGFYFKKNKYDAAIDHYKKALTLKESLKDYKGCGDLLYNIGYMYYRMGINHEAISYYIKALDIYVKIDEKKEVAGMQVKIGNIYFNKGDYETAVNYYKSSLKISEDLKDTLRLGNSYQMIGAVFHEWGRYPDAIKNYNTSLKYFEKLRHKQGIANNYINIGLVYQSMNKSIELTKTPNKEKEKDKIWKYNNDKALEYFSNANKLMKELKDDRGIMNTLNSIGQAYHDAAEYKKAIAYYDTALTSAREAADKEYIQDLSKRIGYSYFKLKKYEMAEKYYREALSKAEELDSKTNISEIYYKLGLLYTEKGNYENAIKNLNQSLDILKKVKQKEIIRDVYLAFSDAYEKTGNNKVALEYYKRYVDLKDSMLNEQTLDLITNVETKYQTEKKEQAIVLLNKDKALQDTQIRQQRLILWVFVAGFVIIIVFSVLLYRQFNEKKKANEILKEQQEEILTKNEELQQQKEEIQAQAELLEETNKELEKLSVVASKTDNAVIIADQDGVIEWINDGFIRLFGYTLDEFKAVKSDKLMEVSSNLNFKEDLQKSIREQKSVMYTSHAYTKNGDEIWLQTTLTPIFDHAGALIKIIAIDSDITKIKLAEQEVEKQRDIALKQRDLITEQKNEITDSINYAKQIQSAVLPTVESIAHGIEDFFILFKPRDIVSGDFYWATVKENKLIVAAVDCTGHGVPGAFMSMLGIAFLNEIVNKLYESRQNVVKASEILDLLRDRVITSLHQTGKLGEAQDGMDVALCIIDHDKKELQYAGANNPLYIVSSQQETGGSEMSKLPTAAANFTLSKVEVCQLLELKPDKMPIGIHNRMGSFTNHYFSLHKGDAIYIFSDGYADQFGGEKAMKFKYKQLQELLLNVQHHTMNMQKEILEQRFEEWKGELDQIDDVVIIGLKI
ncbi:MAG: tetratricopeptide repeat protein [Bacteroidia bacterium]|nr:tetratricopeptide repeat protein [Bacteroidia bacterium]